MRTTLVLLVVCVWLVCDTSAWLFWRRSRRTVINQQHCQGEIVNCVQKTGRKRTLDENANNPNEAETVEQGQGANTTETLEQVLPNGPEKALMSVCPNVDLDEKVTLNNIQEAFSLADVNKDGTLDADELNAFATMTAVAEACVRTKKHPPQ